MTDFLIKYTPIHFKRCSKCKFTKSIFAFNKNKNLNDGLDCQCRLCRRKYHKDNRKEIGKRRKKYRDNNKDEINRKRREKYKEDGGKKEIARSKKYREENRDQILFKKKEYHENNKDNINRIKREKYHKKDKKDIQAKNKKYREDNKESIASSKKEWYYEHREEVSSKRRDRYENDIEYKLSHLLRTRLRKAIKNNYKSGSAVRDLGCSIKFLKDYLESKFEDNMTWNNWGFGEGMWNIDHVRPLVSFDLTDREQLLIACNYTNLQPLWFEENMSKGSKIR